MLVDKYISGFGQETIRKENCKKIERYTAVRAEIKGWYKEFGLDFPYSSENNFRDSWFHYRKLYQEHSAYEIVCQIAMLDEHLQRAEKDSIIYFFRKAGEALEFWQYVAMNEKKAHGAASEAENTAYCLYNDTADAPNSWVSSLQKMYRDDASGFAACCLKVVDRYILTNSFCTDVQKVLHIIKNYVLELRMGGARIQRVGGPGGYLKKFRPCFEQLVEFCDRYRIKELIVVSELIERLTADNSNM